MNQEVPLLSICIPTYNRPKWFKRALQSIIFNNESYSSNLEIIISDDSTIDECRYITEKTLANWKGDWKYVFNQPRLGMAQNWNYSIQLATGEYVLVLHDDDFLLKGAIQVLINNLKKYCDRYSVLLFGVHIVNAKEQVLRKQICSRELYLPCREALQHLMSNSSFVRFPAIVIHRQAFEEVGYFDSTIGGVADIDMWIRLFSKLGVLCLPTATCAYTVHSEALTMGMFNEEVIKRLLDLFSYVDNLNVLASQTLAKCKSNFFHQFILAGTFRALRRGKLNIADKVMKLFELESLKGLKVSLKWFFLRYLFEILFYIYNFKKLINKLNN